MFTFRCISKGQSATVCTGDQVFEEGYNVTVASACNVKEGGSGKGRFTQEIIIN